MAGVRIHLDARKLSSALEEAARRCVRMRPAWQEIGELVHRSVMRNFEAGGRPKHWPALKASTIMARAGGKHRVYTKRGKLSAHGRKHAFGQKPLIATGRLMRSITYRATNAFAEVGTNLVYAATHQFGRGPIPARPFLVLQPEDERAAADIIERHVLGVLR